MKPVSLPWTILQAGAAAMIWMVSLVALPAAQQIPLTVQETAGLPREREHVTSGVPFPMGALKDAAQVRLVDELGKELPLQVRASATWREGSVKWALLDFPLEVAANGTRRLTLEFGEDVARSPTRDGVRIQETAEAVEVSTGPLRFSVSKTNSNLFRSVLVDADRDGRFDEAERVATGLATTMTLAGQPADRLLHALPPTEVVFEERGPERVVIRVRGWLNDADGAPASPRMQYLWRLHARSGSAAVQAQFTVVNFSPTNQITQVRRYGVRLLGTIPTGGSAMMGGERKPHRATLANTQSALELRQLNENAYRVQSSSGEEQGIRAPGWVTLTDHRGGVLLAVRDFWQQFPKSLRVDDSGLAAELYPAEVAEPFDWDQGLAKTHELLLDFDAHQLTPEAASVRVSSFEHPLFAVAPAQWYCDSMVFGDLAPFDFDLFPDYETLVEAGGDKFIHSMATGIRNWGDFYYGGPYKGKNSYMNLEYDVPHNFLVQFARTGQRKYLDTARIMARHQADIDVNHFTGWQWKHSPRHTEIQAEFGHTFTRGLLEHSFLTGDQRTFEAAVELGDYFAKDFQNPRSLGNERQIGWGLISLLPVYEATWDRKYLNAVNATLDRLITGLDARGKFNIRWDNRIAFFNGIAATGLIYVHRATGDERVADAALRVIGRTKGFYPEYSGRTLEALAWAYQRTQDPDYLDLLKLTYETTQARALSWRTMELGAMTIFTMHALPWIARSGLARRPAEPLMLTPEQFASENGLHAHHLPHSEGEIYFRSSGEAPLKLVIVRKGAWKGTGEATLLDPAGALAGRLEFRAEAVAFQRQVLTATNARAGAWLLKVRGASAPNDRGGSLITWDVVTPLPTPAVMATPRFEGLQYVTPRLYTVPKADTTRIELTLVGEGEGFKKAVLCDPEGRAVATLARFVDLGDKGRYEYKLSTVVPEGQRRGLWSLALQDVALTAADGLTPYFSTSPQSFFRPDQ